MPEQFETRYFRGQGPMFIAARDANGQPAGLEFVGDISSADLTPDVERSKVIENVSGQGGIGASFTKRVGYALNIVFRSIKPSHLARIVKGTSTAKVSASVTDEAHKGYHDKMTPLDHVKVSAVTVTGTGGTPTYVADTDYVLHADEGMIEVLSTGSITDGGDIEVDYTYAAQHLITAAPSNEDLYIVFGGMNSADNDKQTRCEIYKATLDPGVLGMVSDEPQELAVSGEVVLDTLRAAGDQFYSWKTED